MTALAVVLAPRPAVLVSATAVVTVEGAMTATVVVLATRSAAKSGGRATSGGGELAVMDVLRNMDIMLGGISDALLVA